MVFSGMFLLSGREPIFGFLKLTTSYGLSRYSFTFYHTFFLIGNIFWLFCLMSSLFEQSMAFVCYSCGKFFTSAEKLRAHEAVHEETKIQCHICDKEFEGKKKFNNHIQSHQIFECEICHQTIKINNRSNHSRKCGQKKVKERIHKLRISRKIGTHVIKKWP